MYICRRKTNIMKIEIKKSSDPKIDYVVINGIVESIINKVGNFLTVDLGQKIKIKKAVRKYAKENNLNVIIEA